MELLTIAESTPVNSETYLRGAVPIEHGVDGSL